jgi:hypothetical protein
MTKTYKDYCREAVARDPKTYGHIFNPDGSRKPPPKISSIRKRKVSNDIPASELRKLEKNGWKPCDNIVTEEKPELEVTGTEIKIKGRIQNLTIKEIPPGADKREYNRIWMQNDRVRKKIKELKKKYGDAIPL